MIPQEKEILSGEEQLMKATIPVTSKKRSSKVDTGKIMALYNAGWNYKKIADEMQLHPITISKYVKQFNMKKST